ncbi:MAG: N-acetyl-gamma-glutamyl-phosphate reductase [Candidatus Binatia bacterium]
MSAKVYLDGHAGTTGLRVREWLSGRSDVEVLTLPEDRRKNSEARRETILSADVAILCLPDAAAREVAGWVQNGTTRLIDASTAHRVSDGWVFGLPELQSTQRDRIRNARLVSNPGCYSSAFILLTRPLIDEGLISRDAPLVIHALSGYSGGGRSLIERWEKPEAGLRSLTYEAPYAFDAVHKHIPEMIKYSGLIREPQFLPAVGPFRCGMRVQVPLHAAMLNDPAGGRKLWEVLSQRYCGEVFVKVIPLVNRNGIHEKTFAPQSCNDTNRIELRVLPHPSGHVTLMATLDNLGKGACGMAIQSLNLMLGIPEETGLPT